MPAEVTNPGTGEFPTNLRVAVLGGTGPQGRGLARRFAEAGLDVIVGSRAPSGPQALPPSWVRPPGVRCRGPTTQCG